MNYGKTDNVRKTFSRTIAKAVSWIMVTAMLIGALPAVPVYDAEAATGDDTNITLHFENAKEWSKPIIQYWQYNDVTATGGVEEVTIEEWGVKATVLTPDSNEKFYSATLTGSIQGFQFIDYEDLNNKQSAYTSSMAQFTDSTPKDLYFLYSADENDWKWYLDENGDEELVAPELLNITVHFKNIDNWDTPVINVWGSEFEVTGVGEKVSVPSWNSELPTLTQEDSLDASGYYSASIKGDVAGIQILDPSNPNSINHYDAVSSYKGETTTDLYLVNSIWYDDIEEIPANIITDCEVVVHFKNDKKWDRVYSMIANGDSWSPISGYEFCKENTGGVIAENSKNSGWHSYKIKKTESQTINGNFNAGEWGDATQTNTYTIPITNENTEVWVTFQNPAAANDKSITVSDIKPSGWVDTASIPQPIHPSELSTLKSPVINEDGSVTFNYELPAEYDGEKVYLMGTLTDWDEGKEMKDIDGDGIYSITLSELTPGIYQYKFRVMPSNSWNTDPLNKEFAGGNSVVKIPGLIIYSDNLAGTGTFLVETELPEGSSISQNSIQWSLITEDETAPEGISVAASPDDPTKAIITTTDNAKSGYFQIVVDYEEDEKPNHSLKTVYYTERAFLYEYEYKENSKYDGKSDIYSWYNSKGGNTGVKFREMNGKNTAYITLDDNAKTFGYIIRLNGEWGASENEDREFKDRTISAYEGERYTKAKGGEGIEVPTLLPSGKSYYDNGITFAFRDDEMFYNNTLAQLEGKVNVVVTKDSGTSETYPMSYSAEDELFTYSHKDIDEGIYKFYFDVDGKCVEDQYFQGEMEYKNPDLAISIVSSPETVNYDQNPVLTFDVTAQGSGENVTLSSIVADLTALGFPGVNVPLSHESKKGVLYVDRSVTPGEYTIPITVTDQWGNDTDETTKIKVVDKTGHDTSWDESRIYFLLTDRFMNGDTSNDGVLGKDFNPNMAESYHGGDLKGITKKLGYLQGLGINTIWVTPIVDNIDYVMDAANSQYAYHGYWATDFTVLDEHLGTTADLDELLDEAHKRGIKVMVDVVLNHAGYGTNDNSNFTGMLREDAVTSDEDVIKGELDRLPDFITEDPVVRETLINWQTAWANHTTANGNRIDYFRVDTVKHVEHETWQDFKTALAEVNPSFKMIGEYFGGSISNTGDYLGNGQMDALLDFDFKSLATDFANGNIDLVEAGLESRNTRLSNSVTVGQFLGSHDEDGYLYSLGGDTSKMKLAAALQLTAKGIPVIYYGEEINLTGPNAYAQKNNNRYDMQFDKLTADQKEMLTHYQKLLAARAMHSEVFATGSRTKVAGSDTDKYLVFERKNDTDNIYVGLNVDDEDANVTFAVDTQDDTLIDLYSGNTVTVSDNKVSVTIPANNKGGTIILADEKELTNMEMIAPYKTDYYVGDDLDLDGLAVTGIYGDTKVPVSANAYTLNTSGYNKNVIGTYTLTVSYGNFSDTFKVTVKEKPVTTPKPIKVNKITFDKKSYAVAKGSTVTIKPTVAPSNAANKGLDWKSSNEKVATVNASGKISGKSYGTANMTATAKDGSGVKVSAKVTVGYKITYKLNKGKNNAANPASYYKQKVSLKKPTRKGYTFAGWYKDAKFKKKISSISNKATGNTTVYAKWVKVKKPAKPVIQSLKNPKSKQLAVTTKKIKGVKGYEITCATDKRFKKNKTVVTSKKNKTTIKKLKKGTTYFVKVRAYHLDSTGAKVYGKYSGVKSLKLTK